MATTLRAEMIGAVSGPLGELGFEKRAGRRFMKELEPGLWGWVSLPSRYLQGNHAFRVSANVGIYHQEVARLDALLKQKKFSTSSPVTVLTSLGTLMPTMFGPRYFLQQGADMAEEAGYLAGDVSEYGLPFMTSLCSLTALLQAVDEGMTGMGDFAGPILCLLLGDGDEAERRIGARLHDLEGSPAPFAPSFRAFAENFRAYAREPRT